MDSIQLELLRGTLTVRLLELPYLTRFGIGFEGLRETLTGRGRELILEMLPELLNECLLRLLT